MIVPPYLKKGSTIAVAATARFADATEIDAAVKMVEAQGYKVVLAANVCSPFHRFAGEDAQRIQELQALLDSPEVDAIWFARGGYGSVRIIDALDWTRFIAHPKWLIGFSDMTLFHSKLHQLNIASIHGCNFGQLPRLGLSNENVITVLECLTNQDRAYSFATSGFNIEGHVRGRITGGNLTMICNSIGTPTQINADNCILMIEDCDEYGYHYDRMLHQLKRSGLLKNIRGLVVGDSSIKPEPGEIDFGYSLKEMVVEICSNYYFPVCFNAPFGHLERNYALKMNIEYDLKVSDEAVILKPFLE